MKVKLFGLLMIVMLLSTSCGVEISLPQQPTPAAANEPTPTTTPTDEPTPLPTPDLPSPFVEVNLDNYIFPDTIQITLDNIGQIKKLQEFGMGEMYTAEWTSDGKYIIVGFKNGIRVYEANNLSIIKTLRLESTSFNSKISLSVDPDTGYIIGIYNGIGENRLFELNPFTNQIFFDMPIDQDYRAVFANNEYIVLNGRSSNKILDATSLDTVFTQSEKLFLFPFKNDVFISLDSSKYEYGLFQPGNPPIVTSFTPEKSRPFIFDKNLIREEIAIGFLNGGVKVFNTNTKELFPYPTIKNAAVESLRWSASGKYIASSDYDGNIFIWDASARQLAGQLSNYKYRVVPKNNGFAFSADDQSLAVISYTGAIQIFNIPEMTLIQENQGELIEPLISPDGHIAASLNCDGLVTIWDLQTNKVLRVFSDSYDDGMLDFSHDGKYLAVATGNNCTRSADGPKEKPSEVVVFNLQTNEVIYENNKIGGFAEFSADGRSLISCGAMRVFTKVYTNWTEVASFKSNVKCGAGMSVNQTGSRVATSNGLLSFNMNGTMDMIYYPFTSADWNMFLTEFSPNDKLVAYQNNITEESDYVRVCKGDTDKPTTNKCIADVLLFHAEGFLKGFSPDSQILAMNSDHNNGNTIFYNTDNGDEIVTIADLKGNIQWNTSQSLLYVLNDANRLEIWGIPKD